MIILPGARKKNVTCTHEKFKSILDGNFLKVCIPKLFLCITSTVHTKKYAFYSFKNTSQDSIRKKKNYLINFLKDIHSQQINNRVQKNLNKTDTVNLHGWKVNMWTWEEGTHIAMLDFGCVVPVCLIWGKQQ